MSNLSLSAAISELAANPTYSTDQLRDLAARVSVDTSFQVNGASVAPQTTVFYSGSLEQALISPRSTELATLAIDQANPTKVGIINNTAAAEFITSKQFKDAWRDALVRENITDTTVAERIMGSGLS